jgi:zona occludens toxin (predicted ATPase)
MIGLILIILRPFKNLFKIPKLRWFAILLGLIFIVSLYIIIQKMLGL